MFVSFVAAFIQAQHIRPHKKILQPGSGLIMQNLDCLFIGVHSVFRGDGEWVMQTRNITVKNYTRLMDFFDPEKFGCSEMGRYG